MDLVSQLLNSDSSAAYKNLDNEKGASTICDEYSKKNEKSGSKKYILGALLAASIGVNCYFAVKQSTPAQTISLAQYSAGDLSQTFNDFVSNLNDTVQEQLGERNETFYSNIEQVQQAFEENQERVTRKINRKIEKLSELEGLIDSLENRTLSEIADEVTTAYINAKYDFTIVTVYDANTGLPVPNAQVTVYDSYYNAYYYPIDSTFAETTSDDGTTSELQLLKDGEYYVIVSADGYVSQTTTSGSVDDTYYLQIAGPTIRVVNSWTAQVDIDISISSSAYRYIYKDSDITTAPGGETVTFTPEIDTYGNPEKFYVYAHAYGGQAIGSTGASVSIYVGDQLVNTIDVPSDDNVANTYWAVAAISYNGTVIPINTIAEDSWFTNDLGNYF